MTPEQYKQAGPIISRLEATEKALVQMNTIKPSYDEDNTFEDGVNPFSKDFMNDCDPKDGFKSPYSIVLCENRDGSGFHVDMTGANVAREVWDAVYKVLRDKREVYLAMLDDIE